MIASLAIDWILNKRLKTRLLVVCSFLALSATGQVVPYAQRIVRTLCDPTMDGRGYVGGGDKRAAGFIADEFEKLGLKDTGNEYLQTFSISVNTLPGKLSLTANGKMLIPGQDYLADPGSPTTKGTYSVTDMQESELLDQQRLAQIVEASLGKFIIIRPSDTDLTSAERQQVLELINFIKYNTSLKIAGVIQVVTTKLTWHGSTQQNPRPSFTVNAEVFPQNVSSVGVNIQAKFIESYRTQNIVGLIEGSLHPDSVIILTAHYDHLGRMGRETYFPGANDNASGTAMLLSLADYYSKNPPLYTILFIAFAAEELGLLGSAYYVDHPLLPLSKTKFLLNFDIAGTGDDGIQVVNGSVYPKEFELLRSINEDQQFLKEVKVRGEACNSDHCLFYRKGVPGFFIYTLGGIQAYHDIYDKSETLPLTEFEDYFSLITSFLDKLQSAQ